MGAGKERGLNVVTNDNFHVWKSRHIYTVGQKVMVADDRDFAGTVGIIKGVDVAPYIVPNRTGVFYAVYLPGINPRSIPGVNQDHLTFWEEDLEPITVADLLRMRDQQ